MALLGQKASQIIKATKTAMLVMGVPWAIKTDNGPAYTSDRFKSFIESWGIIHSMDICYDPQGQAIVEKTNRTLKELIMKQNTSVLPRDPHLAWRKLFSPLIFLLLMNLDSL